MLPIKDPCTVLIVVSPDNRLIDWGEPTAFSGHMLHLQLAKGHIIRYVTEEQFEKSPLNKKHI